MSRNKKEFLYFLVLLVLVLVTYWDTLNGFFLTDDALWIMQAKKVHKDMASVFQPVSVYLRPGITFICFIIYTFFKLNPQSYHAISIFLHFANCVVMYGFCKIFLKEVLKEDDTEIPLLSALFFSVLYAHCEAVIWIGAMGDLMICFLCLLSFIFFILSLRHHLRILPYLLSLATYFLSLFFKESAFVFPLVLLIFCHNFREKDRIRFLIPYVGLTFVWLAFYKTTNILLHPAFGGLIHVAMDTGRAVVTLMMSFVGYGENIVWILKDVNQQLYLTKAFFQVLSIGGSFFYIAAYVKKRGLKQPVDSMYLRACFFFFWFALLAYLPVAVFIFPGYFLQLSLRYLYFPSIGFCILCAMILSRLFKYRQSFILKSAFIGGLLVVNMISVYQTQWAFNYLGGMRKSILWNVRLLRKNHDNRPYIFLIGYPDKIMEHLHGDSLMPLFKLYGENVFFLQKRQVLSKAKVFNVNTLCFFEWQGITFKDRTEEYIRWITSAGSP